MSHAKKEIMTSAMSNTNKSRGERPSLKWHMHNSVTALKEEGRPGHMENNSPGKGHSKSLRHFTLVSMSLFEGDLKLDFGDSV